MTTNSQPAQLVNETDYTTRSFKFNTPDEIFELSHIEMLQLKDVIKQLRTPKADRLPYNVLRPNQFREYTVKLENGEYHDFKFQTAFFKYIENAVTSKKGFRIFANADDGVTVQL